eukprot:RCo012900
MPVAKPDGLLLLKVPVLGCGVWIALKGRATCTRAFACVLCDGHQDLGRSAAHPSLPFCTNSACRGFRLFGLSVFTIVYVVKCKRECTWFRSMPIPVPARFQKK